MVTWRSCILVTWAIFKARRFDHQICVDSVPLAAVTKLGLIRQTVDNGSIAASVASFRSSVCWEAAGIQSFVARNCSGCLNSMPNLSHSALPHESLRDYRALSSHCGTESRLLNCVSLRRKQHHPGSNRLHPTRAA